MKCKQYYPVIMTDDVAGTAKFYSDHFRFRPTFESDWYVHLQSSEDAKVNIAILRGDHETILKQRGGVFLVLSSILKQMRLMLNMRGFRQPTCLFYAR